MTGHDIRSLRIEVDGPVDARLLPAVIRARLAGRTVNAGSIEDDVAQTVAKAVGRAQAGKATTTRTNSSPPAASSGPPSGGR